MRHGRARVSYPRGTHEAEATGEVDWWDRTRAENITITITITIWLGWGVELASSRKSLSVGESLLLQDTVPQGKVSKVRFWIYVRDGNRNTSRLSKSIHIHM